MRRIGGCAVAAAALAGAAASPAAAMISPACSTRLAAADTGTTASCSFDNQYDWATITVEPAVGSVLATVRCIYGGGYTYTTSRSVSKTSAWSSWTPGYCTLTLTSQAPLTTANATSTPNTGPIIHPYPVP